MGIFSAIFGGNDKTHGSEDTTFNRTTTPINPGPVTEGLTDFAGKIGELQGMDPYGFTVGADPLQKQASGTAGTLGSLDGNALNVANGDMSGAADVTRGVLASRAPQMQAARANGYIPDYMDPYLNDVVKSSLAGYDQNSGVQNAQANLDLAGDSTFGGSGGSIYKALLNQNLAMGRGQMESGLRSQGFAQALAAAQQDANRSQEAGRVNAGLRDNNLTRQLSGAGQLGDMGTQYLNNQINYDQTQRGNIDSQERVGEANRQIDLQHKLAPLSTAQAIAGIWGSAPFGLLHGENTSGEQHTKTESTTEHSPSIMSALGQVASTAGSFMGGLGGLGSSGGGGIGSMFASGGGGMSQMMQTPMSLSGLQMPARFGQM